MSLKKMKDPDIYSYICIVTNRSALTDNSSLLLCNAAAIGMQD